MGETGLDARQIGHDIKRVADDDDDGIGGIGFDRVGDTADDAGIDLEQIITAHAGLAGDAAGDDDDIAAFAVGGII